MLQRNKFGLSAAEYRAVSKARRSEHFLCCFKTICDPVAAVRVRAYGDYLSAKLPVALEHIGMRVRPAQPVMNTRRVYLQTPAVGNKLFKNFINNIRKIGRRVAFGMGVAYYVVKMSENIKITKGSYGSKGAFVKVIYSLAVAVSVEVFGIIRVDSAEPIIKSKSNDSEYSLRVGAM